ncbi:hypothetical protein ACFX2F_005633 [Malus domestica]
MGLEDRGKQDVMVIDGEMNLGEVVGSDDFLPSATPEPPTKNETKREERVLSLSSERKRSRKKKGRGSPPAPANPNIQNILD